MEETLTFQFGTESGLFDLDSAFIRWRTDCGYSHVDIVLPNDTFLGARLKGGVQIRKRGYATFDKIIQIQISVDKEKALQGYKWLYEQVGKAYDWKAIMGLGFHRNWRDDSAWFCSELAFAFVEECGILNFSQNIPEVPVNWLTPRDLILALGALKGKLVVL